MQYQCGVALTPIVYEQCSLSVLVMGRAKTTPFDVRFRDGFAGQTARTMSAS
jgi:hypothetical protein